MKKYLSLKKFIYIMFFATAVVLFSNASYSKEKVNIDNLRKVDPSSKPEKNVDKSPNSMKDKNGKYITIGESFVGEIFSYDVSFWIFKNAAKGRLRMERGEKPGEYVGIMEAQTTGVLGFFLRHRKDTYISKVVEIDNGRRFRTVSFENLSLVGKKERRTLQTVDYENRLFTKRVWSKGRERSGAKKEIPEGISFDDPVAAFYNLRFGAYGEIKPGENFVVRGLPRDEELEMTVNVATEKDFEKRITKGLTDVKFICDIHIDKELFDSKSGNIEIFFTEKMVPVVAVAKDVMMFGDVYGVLKYDEADSIKTKPRKPSS